MAGQKVDFRRDIYPILSQRCFECHLGKEASSGYRLDLRESILRGSDNGPVAEIGKSARSRLIGMVTSLDADEQMPPEGKRLDARQIGLLRAWIDQGLVWDESLLGAKHWAFVPVSRPAVPRVRNPGWVRNPIDAFIAARHDANGLVSALEASRPVLLRRLALDLLGLPPEPEQVEAFSADRSPDAYERLVDRLLASPHYGERWGRHWLDVARWAESEGYESNHPRPYAWRYRDYVIESFNADVPFARFCREQIAGDEIVPYSDRNLVATGFLAAARLSSNEEDKWRQRNDVLVDVVDATAGAFLGLTFRCCQCHDHKFDPITHRDFYRFQGFFLKGQPANLALRDPRIWAAHLASKPPQYDAARELRDLLFEQGRANRIAEARKRLRPEQLRALKIPSDRRTVAEEKLVRQATLKFQHTPGGIERGIPEKDKRLYEELKKKVAELEKTMRDVPQTLGFYSPVTSPTRIDTLPMLGFYPLPYQPTELARARPRLLVRGDVNSLGPLLDVGWPEVFGPTPAGIADQRPRSALADWLTDPKNPLTARVWVNRLWHYHFGRGLVATPGNFGLRGARPTHPELLDWLAAELVGAGWSTKRLHRLIVCSATYRQASRSHAGNAGIDPDNQYWWRWMPHRLEAETLRDEMLAVSGQLDRTMGGRSAPQEQSPATRRRALYIFQERDKPPPLQSLFDGPSGVTESCHSRIVSTTPLQSLFLMNNEFAVRCARSVAQRAGRAASADVDKQIEAAFALTLGRRPDDLEMETARQFFGPGPGADTEADPGLDALVRFCQALMNLNEFVYLE